MTDTLTPAAPKTSVEKSRGRVHTQPCQKRVRTYLGGALVADSIRTVLVWEKPQ